MRSRMDTMATSQQTRPVIAPNYKGPRLFGAPVGDFSVLQTLLITGATGVASFFAATFCAIMVLLVLTQFMGMKLDFADSYKFVGLPFGILMLVSTAVYLGSLLVMRLKRQGSGS
jgi:hypothetical protein